MTLQHNEKEKYCQLEHVEKKKANSKGIRKISKLKKNKQTNKQKQKKQKK